MLSTNQISRSIVPNQKTGARIASKTPLANANERISTFAMALIAAFGVHLLRMHASNNPLPLLLEFSFVLVVSCIAWFRVGNANHESMWLMAGSLCIGLPWLSSLVQVRLLGHSGEATELIWIAMLQVAALWQSAIARNSRQEWTSFLLSSFLMVFGLATSDRTGMVVIVVLYGMLAAWWMMSKYWQKIEKGFVTVDSVPLIRLRLGALAIAVLLTGVIGGVALSTGSQLSSLDGFMPTSGGKGDSDPAARNGIGDGDMLVAAKDQAYTFGPVESDLFMDSKTPSLYDLISDLYGEPFVRREQLRSISLDSKTQEAKEEGSESKKRSREFSAIRKPREETASAKPKGSESPAVFHLIGRVPQHLRLETYDHFDGVAWTQSEDLLLNHEMNPIAMETMQGKPWMRLQRHAPELAHRVHERQTVKIIGLKSPRLVTPSLLTHTYIDKVDQVDFYGWTADGQLMMPNRDNVPQLTVVHQMYQTPQLHALRDTSNWLSRIAMTPALRQRSPAWIGNYLQIVSSHSEVLSARTKESIAGHLGRSIEGLSDWQKIEGVVGLLRSRYTLDSNANVPPECTDAVTHFLDCKQGPDYLFASAAVAMIRSLGVPSRMVTGFYASPDHYDFKSGQTEVLPEHLHTWAEVYCHGVWLTIEPTPGYAFPNEFRTWNQHAIEFAWSMRDSLVQYPIFYLLGLSSILLLVLARRRIADAALSFIAMAGAIAPPAVQVRWIQRLLEWRCWIHSRRYSTRTTVAQRLSGQLNESVGLMASERDLYIQAVNRMAYAPKVKTVGWLNEHAADLRTVCWAIAKRGWLDLIARPKFPLRSQTGTA